MLPKLLHCLVSAFFRCPGQKSAENTGITAVFELFCLSCAEEKSMKAALSVSVPGDYIRFTFQVGIVPSYPTFYFAKQQPRLFPLGKARTLFPSSIHRFPEVIIGGTGKQQRPKAKSGVELNCLQPLLAVYEIHIKVPMVLKTCKGMANLHGHCFHLFQLAICCKGRINQSLIGKVLIEYLFCSAAPEHSSIFRYDAGSGKGLGVGDVFTHQQFIHIRCIQPLQVVSKVLQAGDDLHLIPAGQLLTLYYKLAPPMEAVIYLHFHQIWVIQQLCLRCWNSVFSEKLILPPLVVAVLGNFASGKGTMNPRLVRKVGTGKWNNQRRFPRRQLFCETPVNLLRFQEIDFMLLSISQHKIVLTLSAPRANKGNILLGDRIIFQKLGKEEIEPRIQQPIDFLFFQSTHAPLVKRPYHV